MTDEDRIRELIRRELEVFIKAHGWPDEQVQQALLEVAKAHMWNQGALVRLRYWANVVGMIGILGAAVLFIVSVLGFEVARK
jgi:hypothetical protein